MPNTTIDTAITTLNTLLRALENAYWDSTNVMVKDRVFDLYSIVNIELTELSKLSVNDLQMSFEATTEDFRASCRKLGTLKENIDDWFPRTSTAEALHAALPPAGLLVADECRI